jgi:predicted flap endonuclease-1-like 5' DNA nuclease
MTTRKVTFILPHYLAKGADSGLLLGDFNNWNMERGIQLTKNDQGDLYATVELISGEFYQYRYFLSDGRWENDDRAHSYHASALDGVENCVVFVSASEEYFTEHSETTKPVGEKKPAKKAATKVAPLKTEKASGAAKKISTAKEDLSLIEGINKATADLLNQKGINTFSRLSKSTIKSLKELLEEAGSKFESLNPSAWPKEAKAHIAAKAKSAK